MASKSSNRGVQSNILADDIHLSKEGKTGIQVCGYAANHAKAQLTPYSFSRREPRDHDIVIEIHYCGICHSDIHQVSDEWGGSTFPMVPGHEIAGRISAVGADVKKLAVGDLAG